MKKIILLFLAAAFMLCGCQKAADYQSVSSDSGGYAVTYLEYEVAKEHTFLLSAEEKTLKKGDKIGNFKLEKLLTRKDETGTFSGVRAEFSCDITVSGTFAYTKSGAYGSLLKFIPDDFSLFPTATQEENPSWFVVLENNNPFEILGLSSEAAGNKHTEIKISSYSFNKTAENTVFYIQIEK